MTGSALTWPTLDPAWGRVHLRAFTAGDVAMVRELATDPYVPLIGSLPAQADDEAATGWIRRQWGRLGEGAGYTIRPSARGRGLAGDALTALTRVELFIEPGNEASRRTAERAGYRLEATLPQHQEIGGRMRDMCRYAIGRRSSSPHQEAG